MAASVEVMLDLWSAALREDGEPITGEVTYEVVPTRPTRTTRFFGLRARGYPPAVPNDPEARLLVRDTPGGPAIELPRASWRFARLEGGDVVEDPASLYLERGFEPGRIYQLVYTARDPKVVGLGMVAVRDGLDFFGREAADRDGNPNPLADALPEAVLISGFSQSGRLIQHMLLEGFHRTEGGEPAFDGALVLVAGGGKGGFNHRFAQTTRHFSQFEDLIYRSDFFPFATVPTTDPATGRTGSVFAEARGAGPVPKVVYVNTPLEYWTRSASLLHTDPQGERDVGADANARIYMIAGAQHFVGRFPRRGEQELCNNPMDYHPVLRALLVALRDWVVDGDEPPPSLHPTIEGSTLVTVDAYRERFLDISGVRLPVGNLRPPRLDHGPRFAAEGIVDLNPPRLGEPFVALVPAPDADGLDTGGIVPPAVAAPVGTYTGWALRTEATGMPDTLMRWTGSFVPFARSRAERTAAGDPHPALQERYGSPEAYAAAVEAAAERLVEGRLLPAADVDGVVADAAGFYERVLKLDPSDPSCSYLGGP